MLGGDFLYVARASAWGKNELKKKREKKKEKEAESESIHISTGPKDGPHLRTRA